MTHPTGTLNPAQSRAVAHRDGPLLIIAGPGSGKTRVMTHRIAQLVASGVPPHAILAITFTNKAANEMARRTLDLLMEAGQAYGDTPIISTFHSFCARFLRREIYRLEPYHVNFAIYDTVDQLGVMDEALALHRLDKNSFPARATLSQVSRWKNDMVSAEQAHDEAETHRARQLAQLFRSYQKSLVERNALDFDDLLLLTLRLLRENEEVRERRRGWHRYLMVDEFQDTNRPQYLMARILADGHRNLCVTGDPDQSIYSWRGASPENFDDFARDFPEHEIVPLDQNYRSTPEILAAASRLTHGIGGGRALFTDNPAGEVVRVRQVTDEKAEARDVVRAICNWVAEGTPLREIAVLYRINALSRNIEEELVRQQIPYTVVGGIAFYQRKEIKDVLAYLRAALFPRDEIAFLRAINTPPRGVGRVTVERLQEAAAAQQCSLGELLGAPERWHSVASRARKALTEFARILELLRTLRERPLFEQIEAVVKETDYAAFLEKSEPESWRDRLDNIEELVAAAEETETMIRQAQREEQQLEPLTIFLERVSLATDVDRWEGREEQVALMTVHSAKGLEFDRVIIAGVEDSLFPHARSDEPNSEDEERRLLYVALTRARQSALLFHTVMRRRFREREPRRASPFLEEVAGDGVEFEEVSFGGGGRGSYGGSGAANFDEGGGDYAHLQEDPFLQPHESNPWDEDDELFPGVWLEHDQFGRGCVTATSGFGSSKRVTVRFEEHGEKQFVASYAPFRIIGAPDE